MSIRVVARFLALPDRIEELRDVLVGLIEPTRQEQGCVLYELLQNNQEPREFTFVEEWTSERDLDLHLASDHIAAALERLPELLDGDGVIGRFSVVA